jgi:hypothetical protein
VATFEGIAGAVHETPSNASSNGCDWPATFEIPVAAEWRSGYYSVVLTTPGGERADAFFVVRPPAGAARADRSLLLALSTNTYNAYNDWGGPSLYTGGSRVSFERPLARGFLSKPEPFQRMTDAGRPFDPDALGYRKWARPLGLSDWSGGAGWWNWERVFVAWAEGAGFAFDVCTSADLEFHPEVLEGHRLLASVGHDEYWSWAMRDAVEAHTAGGGNALFLSGNSVYWQVRYEDDGRAMVCFKYGAGSKDGDPVLGTPDERFLTGAWSDHRVGRPENTTTGLSFSRGGYAWYGPGTALGSGGFTVHRPDHWAYEGTGLARGDDFGARDVIAAYEVDGCAMELRDSDGLPYATGEDATPLDFEILATAPAHLWTKDELPKRYEDEPGELEFVAESLFGDGWERRQGELEDNNAVMGTFTTAGGGTVFTAGVIDWTFGLLGGDAAVESITQNVLERLTT